MALAYLVHQGIFDNKQRFKADIGSNQYYQYKIGKTKRKFGGINTIDNVSHSSSFLKVGANNNLNLNTTFNLDIPSSLFDRKSRYIQLFSYRDEQGSAPAISSVISIVPPLKNDHFSISKAMTKTGQVGNKSFCYREEPVSQAMFWDSIMKVAPKILEVAGPIVKGLFGGKKGGGGSSGGGQKPALDMDAIMNAVMQVLGTLGQKNGAGTSQAASVNASLPNRPALSMAIAPSVMEKFGPIIEEVASPEAVNAVKDQPIKLLKLVGEALLKMDQNELKKLEKLNKKKASKSALPLAQSMAYGRSSRYAYAHVAPALLAALPAIAELAKKVLDPKTIEAIGNQPIKLFKAINDGLLAGDKQEMEHLERLNPGVDDPTIMPLLNSMSLGYPAAHPALGLSFHPVKSVKVDFVEVQTIQIGQKEKVVYAKGKDCYFPIQLNMREGKPPRDTLPKLIVELKLVDAEASKVFVHKRFRLKNIGFGQAIRDIYLSAEEMEQIPLHRDLKLDVSAIWPSQKHPGRNFGSSRSHIFCLTGAYVFDRVGDAQGPPQRLNNLATHRAFWHKIWEGGYTKSSRWEIDFELKYYYALNQEIEQASRLDTRKRIVSDNASPENKVPKRRKVTAQLKSGMELSLPLLNDLNVVLGQNALTTDQLEALKDHALPALFNQVARVHLEFRGKSGQTASLWAYPEVKLYQFHFRKIAEVNALGQVTGLMEESVIFPKPVALHFIGTKSK